MVRPVMRHVMSMQSRLFASLLSTALCVAPLHSSQAWAYAAPSLEELYTQGQEAFDAGDYGTAGDKWAEAVRSAEESPDTSATRQTIMNLALDAYLRAYRANEEDRSSIDKAKQLLDEYEASLEPSGTPLTAEIASEKGKIEDILEELAAAEAAAQAETETETEGPDEPPPPILVDENPGRPLIIAGGAIAGGGAIGIGLLLGGVIGGLSAQADFEAADEGSAARDTAAARGRTMNGLAIAGAVLTPVLLGTGVALIAIGAKRNKDARMSSVMILPEAGRGYAGLGLSGRF